MLSLVSGAHFFSHFYLLVLPLLFVSIQLELGTNYTYLGFMMTLYALGSATGQYPVGVMSDMLGPRWFLIGGITLMSICFILMSFSINYWQLALLALLAGLGDSVIHPTDFAVITANVSEKKLGRAYAIHAFMGFAGFAAAPIIIDPLRVLLDWKITLLVVGLAGSAMALTLFLGRNLLNINHNRSPNIERNSGDNGEFLKFLKSGPILTMFLFYVCVAISGSGIQQFSTSALPLLYGVEVSDGAMALFLYLVGVSVGVLVGGLISERFFQFNIIATIGYFIASLLMILVASTYFDFHFVLIAFLVGGFMIGIVFPSRDLMVRSVTPKNSVGKAFGFVNSGFGYGAMVGPLIFGVIMDTGFTQGVYLISAFFMILVILSAIMASSRIPSYKK